MPLFRKKPVVIEAMHLEAPEAPDVYSWIENNTNGSFDPEVFLNPDPDGSCPASGVSIDPRDGRLVIATLEGLHWADFGDWIIRGVQGEFYPCKPDIFQSTYEPA
ncbi:hypothetical protein SEA_SQUEE_11 [Mycobacterium phage Squee]|nr:hypothetical protein SEA_FENN_11 [Mycobacterium phage Fenn]QBI99280.1 hypothetical protein SEA_NAIRA_11 [Mycobacterium phage Naira]